VKKATVLTSFVVVYLIAAVAQVATAAENFVGREFRVLAPEKVKLYKDCGDVVYHSEAGTVLTVTEYRGGGGFYAVRFADGTEACISEAKLISDALADNKKLSRLEAEAAVAAKTHEKSRKTILANLKKAGITPRKAIWSRKPLDGHPGVTRRIVEGVEFTSGGILEIKFSDSSTVKVYTSETALLEDYFIKAPPSWPKKILTAIKNGKVFIGMTKQQVIASWGDPATINRTVGKWGVHEQWVYEDAYLYFENDTLTSFQDQR